MEQKEVCLLPMIVLGGNEMVKVDIWHQIHSRHRHAFYGKNSLGTSAGVIDYWFMNEGRNHTLSMNTGHSGELWQRLSIPAFGRIDSNSVAYFDDVYISYRP